jgi:membrane-associated phospholipid phosphatase
LQERGVPGTFAQSAREAALQDLHEPAPAYEARVARGHGERQTFTQLRAAAQLFRREQPVTPALIGLALVVPIYLWIGGPWMQGRHPHAPAIALDSAFGLDGRWSLVYLSLFLAALLPAFVIHQQGLVRRTLRAYLATWLAAYAVFLSYPTVGPANPALVHGAGFSAWLLEQIYASDLRLNCLPSLHVAQCTLAALACRRVHLGLGLVLLLWASLVALSTLYTKQHYVLDVIAGAVLGYLSYHVFIRGYRPELTPPAERALAPVLAVGALAAYGLIVLALWLAFRAGLHA